MRRHVSQGSWVRDPLESLSFSSEAVGHCTSDYLDYEDSEVPTRFQHFMCQTFIIMWKNMGLAWENKNNENSTRYSHWLLLWVILQPVFFCLWSMQMTSVRQKGQINDWGSPRLVCYKIYQTTSVEKFFLIHTFLFVVLQLLLLCNLGMVFLLFVSLNCTWTAVNLLSKQSELGAPSGLSVPLPSRP